MDHIYSNCPVNISNVRTHNNDTPIYDYDHHDSNDSLLSDHAMLSCMYSHHKI